MVRNRGAVQDVCSTDGWSWGFACVKLWHLWGVEKYNKRFLIETTHRILKFSPDILYICQPQTATPHAHWAMEYYSPRGQAVSMSHFKMDFAWAKRFCIFGDNFHPPTQLFEKTFYIFYSNSHGPKHWAFPRCFLSPRMELRFCMHQAMTSAECKKIQPTIWNRNNSSKMLLFAPKSIHLSNPNRNSTFSGRGF